MGIRLILLAAVLWLLFSAMRWMKKPHTKDTNKTQVNDSVTMMACHHCGVHIPQDDAIRQSGHYYCCDEHAKLGSKEE